MVMPGDSKSETDTDMKGMDMLGDSTKTKKK
jgi:hypothetical protein